jgi:replicative superfamily II helicase
MGWEGCRLNSQELVNELLSLKGHKELRDPQQLAVDNGLLDATQNFIIISPTSSGKTFTAELAIYQTLKNGGKALYLVPSPTLVKEKVDDFQYLAKKGYTVCSPKDENSWSQADILVLTFESFFINILMSPVKVQRFSLAIIDEFHILYDQLRGFNLEKSIILLSEFNLRIICLSATFEDKKEISDWLKAKLVIVPEKYRKVELNEKIIDTSDISKTERNKKIYSALIKSENAPFLIFCNTKPFTISRAKEMMDFIKKYAPQVKPNEDSYSVKNIRDEMSKNIGDRELTDNELHLCECLSYQIGFHNALLDDEVGNYVTNRLLNDKIKWLFTTTTLAYGFNSPTKSVVVFDNTFYDPYINRSVPIPVYVYIQMIGRAGRPQYFEKGENTAYAYVVADSEGDKRRIENDYFGRKLEKAESKMGFNDYAQKAILQLILAQRNQGEQIVSFFNKSLNTYQATKNPLGTYNSMKVIQNHVQWLIENDFIEDIGGGGYRLKPLGKVTVDFISYNNKPYPLISFKLLNEYISKNELKPEFKTINTLCKLLNIETSTKSRSKSDEVLEFFATHGIESPGKSELAAYSIWSGWIENKTPREIEAQCNIYADAIKKVAVEIADGMNLMKKMYENSGKNVPNSFEKLMVSVKYGVRDKEASIVRHRGYARGLAKDLYNTARRISGEQKGSYMPDLDIPHNDILDFYIELYKNEGKKGLKDKLIKHSDLIKDKRAENFSDLIERIVNKN